MAISTEIDPIRGARVWKPADFDGSSVWIQNVSAEACADLRDAVADARLNGHDSANLNFEVCEISSLHDVADELRGELTDGCGFRLLTGLPIEDASIEEMKLMLLILGHHIGLVTPQFDSSGVFSKTRAISEVTDTAPERKIFYNNRGGPLPMHMDPVDVVGLMCTRKAKKGGESGISSSMAVHNEILRTRPDLLEVLYRGYYHISRHDTKNRLTKNYCPVFCNIGSETVCSIIPSVIEGAVEEGLVEFTPIEQEALEYFSSTAARPEFRLGMDLNPGDIQFLNNRAILHNRLDYEDFPEVERKRLMLRVWLTMPAWQKLPAKIPFTDVELQTEPA